MALPLVDPGATVASTLEAIPDITCHESPRRSILVPCVPDGLISLLSILSREGRMTAADLARRLEVSERTILRDLEVLSGLRRPGLRRRAAWAAGSSCSRATPRRCPAETWVRPASPRGGTARMTVRITAEGRRVAAILGYLQPLRRPAASRPERRRVGDGHLPAALGATRWPWRCSRSARTSRWWHRDELRAHVADLADAGRPGSTTPEPGSEEGAADLLAAPDEDRDDLVAHGDQHVVHARRGRRVRARWRVATSRSPRRVGLRNRISAPAATVDRL